MARTYGYFLAGMLLVLVPLIGFLLVKKFDLLEIRPDEKMPYKMVDDQALLLHVFKARTDNFGSPAPALLLFHGGRWQYGDGKEFYRQCRFFSDNGLSCFVAQYRLGSGGIVDVRGAVDDAGEALDYLVAHAGILNIDADRVVVGGASSGGQLAAALGVSIRHKVNKPSSGAVRRPAAMVLYNPMLDLSPCKPDHHLVQQYWRAISPLHHIDSLVPPTLILLGTDDVELPVSSAESFCKSVVGLGGRCELAVYANQRHGFFHYREGYTEYFDKTNARILEFLRSLWK